MLKSQFIITHLLFVTAIICSSVVEILAQTNKIDPQGNVGIGTMNPSAPLEVAGSYNGFTQSRNAIVLRNNGGSANLSSSIVFVGNNTKLWEVTNDFGAQGSNDFYISSHVPSLKIPFYINGSGYIGMGTTSPDSKLTVKGKIHAEEIKVDINVPAPDYVFNQVYKPLDLNEVETYVIANHHLPEIPSAAEMKKDGINLSDEHEIAKKGRRTYSISD
ncbi:hypothetical protein [Arcticibacter tournemirensis]